MARAGLQAAKERIELLQAGPRPHQLLAACAALREARAALALARAVVNDPAVILADEPTAALDTEGGRAVMHLLRRLGRERGAAVIVVTHDERMVEGFDRAYHMTDGRIRAPRGGSDPATVVV